MFVFPIEPGSTLTSASGAFATPKWLPSYPLITDTESFYWIITSENQNTRVSLNFLALHKSEVECSNPTNENEVIMRSGSEETSPIQYQYCLGDLEIGTVYVVENFAVRVEFTTTNALMYGFIAEYMISK